MTGTTQVRLTETTGDHADAWSAHDAVPWLRMAAEAPELATVGEELIERYRMAFLATTTRTGAPRLHPVCPAVMEGHLLVGIRGGTPKHADLRRDPRCVLHALPGESDREFFVRATAVRPADARIRELAAAPDGSGVIVDDGDVLFELLVHAAHTASYEVVLAAGQADYRATRATWLSGVGEVSVPT